MALLAIAAIALGQALQTADGLYGAPGLVLLTLALASAAAAFVPRISERWSVSVQGVLTGGLLLQFLELFIHRPGSAAAYESGLRASMMLHGSLGAAMVCAAMIALGARRWRAAFWTAAALQLACAIWVVTETPAPHMDVWWAQQSGLEALAQGRSPFSSRFPDIYEGTAWYPPGMRDGAWIDVGFPYPPLVVLAALPGYLLAGDIRFTYAVAVTLAGLLIAHLRATRTAALAGLLFVFSPRIFYFVESGWSEPVAILALAAAVFCAVRRPRAVPLALGLAAVSKQTMPILLCLVPLLRDRLRDVRGRPLLLLAFLAGPVLSLIAVLPDLDGFLRSNVRFPAELPLRRDVLSYPAMLANELGIASTSLGVVLGFGLAAAAITAMLRWAPRTPAVFAGACGLVFLVFFAFNKYAACNYYFLPIAAFCCAVAAGVEADEPPFS
jgi:hypothetical protein